MTVFGSARTREDSHEYKSARELASLLAKENLAVITGGGPGIMEAANRGSEGGWRAICWFKYYAAQRAGSECPSNDQFEFSVLFCS